MTIYTASQSPSFVRTEIARLLGWPENRVRVKVGHLGGGFGAKLYIKLEALVVALAMITQRPVRLSLTMEEQFYTISKHASTFHIKSALDAEGKILARTCEVLWNGGAYADIGPRVTQKSGFTATGPYRIPVAKIDSYALYTNRPPAGALRGFGIPQLVWAYESHTDLMAREMGIDPVDFRRRNILKDGDAHVTGTIMKDAAISAVLEKLAERMNWTEPFVNGTGSIRRGRGIAIGFKASVAPTTSVGGRGIVAEVLGLAAEDIRVNRPDTDTTPYDMATLGSRSTYHMGHAVKKAAEHARDQIVEMAQRAGLPDHHNASVADIFKRTYGMQAGTIIGTGSYIPEYKSPDPNGLSEKVTPFWMIGGTGVELEVDTETGRIRLLRMINAVDCGAPLNPNVVETQLSGAAIMQLGFTLSEEMLLDGGQVTNASLADYKIPGIHDIPPVIENHIIDAYQEDGPFGAKGVGESATFGVSPAVAEAIHDACGVRLTRLPITAESLFTALQGKN